MTGTPTISLALQQAQEGRFGPAMSALPTDNQRAFVIALLDNGGQDHTRAAAEAGYSATSRNSLRVTAHRVYHDTDVQAAIQEEAQRRLMASSVLAVSVLIDLAKDPGDKAIQLKAATAILNRTGMHEKTEHKVHTVDESKTDAELIKRARELSLTLGLDANALMGSMGIVDAEFVEVKPKQLAAPLEEWEISEEDAQ